MSGQCLSASQVFVKKLLLCCVRRSCGGGILWRLLHFVL